jgi:type II secretory pathway pseudopilin PulG
MVTQRRADLMIYCRGNSAGHFKFHPLKSRLSLAFTLFELLVVVTIIVLILSFSVPAITGLTKSSNLNSGGRLLSNLFVAARSHAINQRTLVRIEIATVWPSDSSESFRKIAIAQYDSSSSTFKQITRWETLPSGTVIEMHDMYASPPGDIDPTPSPTPVRGTYFTDLFQPTGSLSLDGSCAFAGQSISCVYFEFLPTGGLNATPNPVWLRLSAGVPNGAAVTHTARGKNYADLVVDNLVGRIKFSRP